MSSVPHLERTAALVVAAALAAAGGGTGGGGLFTPLALLSTNSVRLAVPISKASVFGTSAAALLINLPRRHPENPQIPLVNFSCVALLEPVTLAGAILGVALNSLLPNWLVVLLLVLVLLISLRHTVLRAVRLYREERRDAPVPTWIRALEWAVDVTSIRGVRARSPCCCRAVADDPLDLHELSRTQSTECPLDDSPAAGRLLQEDEEEEGEENAFTFSDVTVGVADAYRAASLERQSKAGEEEEPAASGIVINSHAGAAVYGALAQEGAAAEQPHAAVQRQLHVVGIAVLLIDSVAGWCLLWVAGGPRALVCGTFWDRALLLAAAALHFAASLGYAGFLLSSLRASPSLSNAVKAGGYDWVANGARLAKFCGIGFLAGVSAGALGIGGGLLKGPLLLEIGLHPMSASATSTFMVFFTSGANALSYWLQGRLTSGALLTFSGAGVVGGSIGLHLVYMLVRRLRLQSAFALLLAACSALSLLAMLLGESVSDAHVPFVC